MSDLKRPTTDLLVGFTGTRRGLTEQQRAAVQDCLSRFQWLHHGDCLGADWEAHNIATALGLQVHVHPPRDPVQRAFCSANAWSKPKDYIERNHDIVDATRELIATPAEMQEQLRSGTWATIRYARKQGRLVTIIYPDGSLEFSL